MRLTSFLLGGQRQLGVRKGDQFVLVSQIAPDLPTELVDLLARGPKALQQIGAAAQSAPATVAARDVTLLPPTVKAGKILCLGLNYIDHAAEAGMKRPDHPVVFMRGATSLVAAGQPIVRPKCSEQLDYEAELVAIIGTRARHVSRDNALSHVAGYSVFNDGSVRDYQLRVSQWTVGKNFDGTGGFGPDFVTADELPAGAAGLKIEARLNGQTVQSANTKDMVFTVADTVALLSESMTLEPGDLLVMGTPSGVGAARKPPLWMKPGDTIEIEIEKIGLLRNPIAAE